MSYAIYIRHNSHGLGDDDDDGGAEVDEDELVDTTNRDITAIVLPHGWRIATPQDLAAEAVEDEVP